MCTAVDINICTYIVFVLVFVFVLFALEKLHLEIRKQTQSKNIEIKHCAELARELNENNERIWEKMFDLL